MSRSPLSEADKRAVDMLLDELPRSQVTAASGFTSPAKSVVEPAQLDAARRFLSLLDTWEAPEPPVDLVARTLARVGMHPNALGDAETFRPSDGRLDA